MGSEQPIVTPEAEPYRHVLTVEDFLKLEGAGAFEGLGRVELIEGEIFVMAPLHRPHAKALWELTVAVDLAIRDLPGVEGLSPISAELDAHSLPEADIVIARTGGGDRFATPPFVLMLIEVSTSSLRHDLGRKLRLYASARVPEYWVADVNGRRMIRFHAPAGDDYTERAEFAFGDTVPSATISGLSVNTSRLA